MHITGWTLRTYCRTTRVGLRSSKRLHNVCTVSANYLLLVKLRCMVCKHHTTLITMLFVNTSFVSHATCRAKARSASALPTKATPPPPLAVGEPPDTPFSTKKEKTAGEISKMQRVSLVGRSTACRARRCGSSYRLRPCRKLSCGVHCGCSLGSPVVK